MATPKKPPRAWEIDDLLDLGRKSGVTYLKAVPVLILEKWVREGREEGAANYVRTKELARRLVSSGLRAAFPPKGTSNVLAAPSVIQKSRNLTRPPLLEYQGRGKGRMFWVNLPHYEPLLQEYRQKYRELYPEDYEKLFLEEGEPEWELPTPPKERVERKKVKPVSLEPEMEDEIHNLLRPLEQALRDRQQAIKG